MIYDIKLESDDLVFTDNDLVLISDLDRLKQDLYNQIRVLYYSWALDFLYGSKLIEYVNMPYEPMRMVELKKDVIEIMKSESRIVKNSWQLKVDPGTIKVQFVPVGYEEPVILTIKAT